MAIEDTSFRVDLPIQNGDVLKLFSDVSLLPNCPDRIHKSSTLKAPGSNQKRTKDVEQH